MMDYEMELRLLRQRLESIEAKLEGLEDAPVNQSIILATITKISTIPTTSGKVYTLNPTSASFADEEGALVTFEEADGAFLFAGLISGTRIPIEGDRCLAVPSGDRYVILV